MVVFQMDLTILPIFPSSFSSSFKFYCFCGGRVNVHDSNLKVIERFLEQLGDLR